MRKADIEIGKAYIAKVSGKLVPVKIDHESKHGGWMAVNERTGREIRIRSAARLRRPAETAPAVRPDLGPVVPPTDLTSPRKTPAERGIRLAYIRDWRQQQYDAGQDSSMTAFWREHGLCAACRGQGDDTRDERYSVKAPCSACGGTGLVGSEKPAPMRTGEPACTSEAVE